MVCLRTRYTRMQSNRPHSARSGAYYQSGAGGLPGRDAGGRRANPAARQENGVDRGRGAVQETRSRAINPGGAVIDRPAAEAAVRQLLRAIGEDPDREGVRETPRRIAEMY